MTGNEGERPRWAPPILRGDRLEAGLRTLELEVRRRLDGLLQGNHLGLVPGPGSANVLIGGRHHAVSPYIALGAGLIRTDITGPSDVLDLHATENNWGGNIGGGLFLGSGKVTFRGDVRYFKSFETSGDFPQITGDKLGFWRATAGIGLMW